MQHQSSTLPPPPSLLPKYLPRILPSLPLLIIMTSLERADDRTRRRPKTRKNHIPDQPAAYATNPRIAVMSRGPVARSRGL